MSSGHLPLATLLVAGTVTGLVERDLPIGLHLAGRGCDRGQAIPATRGMSLLEHKFEYCVNP